MVAASRMLLSKPRAGIHTLVSTSHFDMAMVPVLVLKNKALAMEFAQGAIENVVWCWLSGGM